MVHRWDITVCLCSWSLWYLKLTKGKACDDGRILVTNFSTKHHANLPAYGDS